MTMVKETPTTEDISAPWNGPLLKGQWPNQNRPFWVYQLRISSTIICRATKQIISKCVAQRSLCCKPDEYADDIVQKYHVYIALYNNCHFFYLDKCFV